MKRGRSFAPTPSRVIGAPSALRASQARQCVLPTRLPGTPATDATWGRARLGGGTPLGTTPDRPWLRSVGRQLAERHLGRVLLAVTGVGDRHLVAGLVRPD